MNALHKSILLIFFLPLTAKAEWIEYINPANKISTVTFSSSSIKRLDDLHYSVSIFTNYSLVQLAEINGRKVQFQSKSETQFFGCETQQFAYGDYELFQNRDAIGSRTVFVQKELIWSPISSGTLQMDFLKKFCSAR
jgi:hypothetical protein